MAKKKVKIIKSSPSAEAKEAARKKFKSHLLINRITDIDSARKEEKYKNDVIVSKMISDTNKAKGGPRKGVQTVQYEEPAKVTNEITPQQREEMRALGVPEKDRYGFSKYLNAHNQGIKTSANSSETGYRQVKRDKNNSMTATTEQTIKANRVRASAAKKFAEERETEKARKDALPKGHKYTQMKEADSTAKKNKNKDTKKKSFLDDFMNFWKGTVGGDEEKIKDAIGSTGEKLDKSKVYNETNRLTNRATNSALLGLPNALNKQATGEDHGSRQKRENPSLLGTIADGAADMSGYLLPGTAAYKAVNATKLGKAAKGATDVVRSGSVTAKNVSKAAGLLGAQGAVAGGAVTGAEEVVKGGINPKDFNAKDAAKRIAIGTALGAVADPVLGLVGPLAKGTVNQGVKSQQDKVLKMMEQLKPTTTPAVNANRNNTERIMQEMLNTPAPQRELVEAITSGGAPRRTSNAENPPMKRIKDGTTPPPVREFEPITSGAQRSSNPLTAGLESNVPIQARPQFPDAESAKTFLENAPSPVAGVKGPVKPEGIQKKLASKTTGVKRDWEDRAIDSKIIEEYAQSSDVHNVLSKNKIGQVEFKDSLYKQARQLPYSHNRAVRSADKTFNPLLKQMNKAGITKEQLDDYALAVHANDILQENATKNMTTADLQAEFEQLRGLDTSNMSVAEYKEVTKELKAIRSELDDLNPYNLPDKASPEWVAAQLKVWEGNPAMVELQQGLIGAEGQRLQMLRQSEDISEELYERLVSTHPNYVSMARDIPEEGFRTQGGPNIVGARKDGSTTLDIKSPTDMAIRNHISAIKRMERNEYVRTIAKYSEIEDLGEVFKRVDSPTANSVTTMVDGQPQHYEVPEYISSFLSNLTKHSEDNLLASVGKSASRGFKKMTTHYNPAHHFLAAARETGTNAYNGNTGNFYTSIGYDIPMGYLDALFGKNLEKIGIKSFKEAYVDQAGNMSQYVATEDTAIREMAEALATGKSPAMKGVSVLNPLKWIEKLGEVGEQGPRLGMMRQATRKGLSDKDAFFEGINLHDHQRAGNTAQVWSQYVPYFNSAIQGNARLLEGMAKNPLKKSSKLITRGLVGISAPTVGAYMLREHENVSDKQKDILRNLQPYQRNMFWYIPSIAVGDDKVFAIPKPPVIGQIFANPIERALDEKMGYNVKGANTAGTGIKEVAQALAPPDSMALINTFMELGANRDFFTGYDIESQYDRNAFVPKGEREGFNQSAFGKLLAGGINKVSPVDVSPAQVDHTIKKTTGTLGTQALEGSNALAHRINPEEVPANVRPFTDVLGKSFKQFAYDETNSPGMKNKLKQLKAEEGLSKKGMTKNEKADFERQDSAYMFDSQMKDLEDEVKEVRKSKDLTPDQKKEEISRLREQQRRLGSKATDWYNQYFSK